MHFLLGLFPFCTQPPSEHTHPIVSFPPAMHAQPSQIPALPPGLGQPAALVHDFCTLFGSQVGQANTPQPLSQQGPAHSLNCILGLGASALLKFVGTIKTLTTSRAMPIQFAHHVILS